MTHDAVAVVLDHTAVEAMGSGSRRVAGIVVAAQLDPPSVYVFVPTVCLLAAGLQRPALVTQPAVWRTYITGKCTSQHVDAVRFPVMYPGWSARHDAPRR